MAAIVGEPDVKYNPKDFDNLRTELELVARNRYPGIVTDFSSQNVVTLFLELLAYLGDHLSYYQDAQAREAFFPTAKLRASLLKHAKLIGFTPQGRVAATALVKIELLVISSFDSIVSSNSVFFTSDQTPVEFRSLADATLLAGPIGTFIEIFVENSQAFQEIFEAEGRAFETFGTTRNPVLLSGIDETGSNDPDVLLIFVDGIPFTIVDSFIDSGPTDTHVQIDLDNLNRLILRFGDGITGVVANGEVLVQGRVGGGVNGNNASITQGPALLNTNQEPISVSFSNAILSSGGADEQSIESIKVQAPLSLQASNRTVSFQDFITNSESVSGIDRALPITSNQDPLVEENKTEVIVLTESPTNAQMIGGNAANTSILTGVDDDIKLAINGEVPQTFTLGTQPDGDSIAIALQAAIRAATPEFPLDNATAYSGFTVDFDNVNVRYVLTTGQAKLAAKIEVFSDAPNDGSVELKIDTPQQNSNVIGAEPAAASIAAVLQVLTVDKPVCNSHAVEVFGPGIEIINQDMRIRFEASVTTAESKAAVRDGIRTNLATFFSPRLPSGIANPEIDFGKTIRFSDLISVVNGTDGVESVDEDNFLINTLPDDVIVDTRDFPAQGGTTVRDETGTII